MKKLLWLIIGIPVLAIGWCLLTFGTLSPCDAYRNEVKKQGTEQAGKVGKAIGGMVADIESANWSSSECAYRVIKLKMKGAFDD